MPLSYSTISWQAYLAKGHVAGGSYAYSRAGTAADSAFRVCGALGQLAFAFAGHGVVLGNLRSRPPSRPRAPNRPAPMWKGTVAAYVVTTACYFPVELLLGVL